MTDITDIPSGPLKIVKALVGLAILATLVAAAAGVILAVADPATGSRAEGALGLTAASAGFGAAGFAVTAAVYAQVKNLWRFAPTWVRAAAWAFIAVAFLVSLTRPMV